jgi:arginase
MSNTQIIIAKSDIAAGIRGAGLGPEALQVACALQNYPLFTKFPIHYLAYFNDTVFKSTPEHALNIDIVSKVLQSTTEQCAKLFKESERSLIFSGDHSNAAGLVSGLCDAYPNEKTGLIWIDAHADLHSPLTSPTGNIHGMPLSVLLGVNNKSSQRNKPSEAVLEKWNALKTLGKHKLSPKIQPENLVLIDIRDTEPEEDILIKEKGILAFHPEDIRKAGLESVISKTVERLSHCDHIYVSFDVDSLDASIAKGTGTPVDDGLSIKEAIQLLRAFYALPQCKVLEVTEINPLLDQENALAKVIAGVLKEVIPL